MYYLPQAAETVTINSVFQSSGKSVAKPNRVRLSDSRPQFARALVYSRQHDMGLIRVAANPPSPTAEGREREREGRGPNLDPGAFSPPGPETAVIGRAIVAGPIPTETLERGDLPHPAGPRILQGHWGAYSEASANDTQTKPKLGVSPLAGLRGSRVEVGEAPEVRRVPEAAPARARGPVARLGPGATGSPEPH